MESLFGDKQNLNRGLLSRILFVKCQSRVGYRTPTSRSLDGRVSKNYHDLCFNALGAETWGALRFDDSGYRIYCRLFDEVELKQKPLSGELEFMGGWPGKLPGQMMRLSGLIHCISAFERGEDPLDKLINEDEANAAEDLARFFLAHTKAVYLEQAEPKSVTHEKYLWKRLNSFNSPKVTKSEIYIATKNYQRGEFSLDDSLNELKRRGYIRIVSDRTSNSDKPTTTIFINKSINSSPFSPFPSEGDSKWTKWTQNSNIVVPNLISMDSISNGFAKVSAREARELDSLFDGNKNSVESSEFEQVSLPGKEGVESA